MNHPPVITILLYILLGGIIQPFPVMGGKHVNMALFYPWFYPHYFLTSMSPWAFPPGTQILVLLGSATVQLSAAAPINALPSGLGHAAVAAVAPTSKDWLTIPASGLSLDGQMEDICGIEYVIYIYTYNDGVYNCIYRI